LTDQELKEIQERLEAATPGPWHIEEKYTDLVNVDGKIIIKEIGRNKSAQFIAHAPTDMRRLLDEVERLRKENEELQNLVDKFSEANRRLRIAVANQK
jgi:hypothetical protein